jgi:hypothetical protein
VRVSMLAVIAICFLLAARKTNWAVGKNETLTLEGVQSTEDKGVARLIGVGLLIAVVVFGFTRRPEGIFGLRHRDQPEKAAG